MTVTENQPPGSGTRAPGSVAPGPGSDAPAPSGSSTIAAVLASLKTRNPLPAADRRARPPVTVIVAGIVLVVLLIAIVVPSVLAPYDPYAIDLDNTFAAPSWSHLFGTDISGRDLLSRVVYGTRLSLGIGAGAVAVATVVAVLFGIAAGMSSRVAGTLANRWIEIMFAFPTVLLGLLLVSVFGPGPVTLICAIGIGIAPGYARIVRGQVLAVRAAPYVEAATALGHSRTRIILAHIAPNSLRPMIVTITLGVGQAVIWASGLAYLGLGVAPPEAEWGALLDAGRTYVTVAWWLEIFPGLVIVVVALAFTVVGRYVGQRLDGDRR